ncbi:MAG TPA: orotate phosphoribosyltransferase [Dehalococcoidia bacterium]|nr:orotate phosphoribosyltransferase [Dehalococcoidia bacterium]
MAGAGASQEDAAALLREAGALLEGHFRLTSGKHSPAYVEKFRLLERPRQVGALCQMIAEHFRGLSPQVVVGPTTGGIIISYEVARLLGLRGIFAEKGEGGGRSFQRGFRLGQGERALIVDDVLTTGGSVREVIEAVRDAGGEPLGVGVLVDRTGGKTGFGQTPARLSGLPFFACLTLELPAYEPASCPLCAKGVPLAET